MKLVWSPETASKAYIDTVKSCELFQESGEAELLSALAGGWNAKMIVEVYMHGSATVATSVGLAIAAAHAGGHHVCMVSDERSRLDYVNAMHSAGVSPAEVVVGGAEEAVVGLADIDFLVVDGRRKDFSRVVRFAKLSHRGAVLVCRNSSLRTMAGFRWGGVLGSTSRVVRSVVMPVGKGLDIAYVAYNGVTTDSHKSTSRWITHIDQQSGEEHVIRG
ncbi:ankyrin repeat/KH domain protein [Actinidia rufa]|uniref:Ankyrin repeat/KH domain protein n=1 Tax=Actinidia rufa TaxID=165716 RepID=A0A7J0F1A4_9ERIC|nr:ankyrin repeat/KH domain protein [Actinidia rufa]